MQFIPPTLCFSHLFIFPIVTLSLPSFSIFVSSSLPFSLLQFYDMFDCLRCLSWIMIFFCTSFWVFGWISWQTLQLWIIFFFNFQTKISFYNTIEFEEMLKTCPWCFPFALIDLISKTQIDFYNTIEFEDMFKLCPWYLPNFVGLFP